MQKCPCFIPMQFEALKYAIQCFFVVATWWCGARICASGFERESTDFQVPAHYQFESIAWEKDEKKEYILRAIWLALAVVVADIISNSKVW